MASRNHSFGVSRLRSWTAAFSDSLPLKAPYPVEHNAACRCFLSIPTINIGCFKAFLPRNSRGLFLPMTNAFHFATKSHALRPLDLVMTQQFSQSCVNGTIQWQNAVLRRNNQMVTCVILFAETAAAVQIISESSSYLRFRAVVLKVFRQVCSDNFGYYITADRRKL